jgi:hypothetical protein
MTTPDTSPRPPSAHIEEADIDSIPPELTKVKRWVVWKWMWKDDKGKWDKPPVDPKTGAEIDQTDPKNWMTFQQARRAARKHGDGIGPALGPKDNRLGIVGIDLDGCIDADGNLNAEAREIVDRFDSYTERTPSGKGLRILIWGDKPGPRCRTKRRPGIEIYQSDRYFTVTGRHLEGTPTRIHRRDEALAALYREMFEEPGSKGQGGGNGHAGDADLFDDALLDRARKAKNGAKFSALFDRGDISDYGDDESGADQALANLLAFWTGRDFNRMESLFGRSALGRRKKWQSRPDYRQRTIDKAIDDCKEVYRPPSATTRQDGQSGVNGRTQDGGSVGFVGTPHRSAPDFSKIEPRPITIDLLPVPALDPCMIPTPFRGWCQDIARRICCPLEYVVATLLVVISGLIGRRVAIRPKRKDDWQVIGNLWGAVVGRPGWLKTPAVEEILRPLKRLVADAFDVHAAAMADWQSQCLVDDAKRTAAKKALEQAAKKGLGDGTLMELAKAASDGERRPEPKPRRYLINDCTIEKCGELLVDNPNGLIMFRDELIGFLKSFERQGHENDRPFYLEAWNGNGSYEFDRIVRGSTHIKGLCLSVFGTIQPGPLGRYLRGAFGGEDCDGFIPRFQVMMYPDAVGEFVNIDEYPDAECKCRAYEVFRAIADLEAESRGCTIDDDG